MAISIPRSPFPLLAGLVAAGVALAVMLLLDHGESRHFALQQRGETHRHLLRWQAQLDALLDKQLSLLHQVAAYARHAPAHPKGFQAFAHQLTLAYPSLHTLVVAPAGEVSLLYPQPSPNFSLHQDLLQEAENSALMVSAIQERLLTLSGPTVLRDGTPVLVGRLALFDPKTNAPDAENRFWGLALIYISWPDVLREARLTPWTTHGERIAIRRLPDGHTPGEVILGERDLFDRDPVTLIQAWSGSTWEIAALPERGWETHWPHHGDLMRLGLVLALVTGGMVMLLAQPDRRRIPPPPPPLRAPDPTTLLLAHLLNHAEDFAPLGHWRWESRSRRLEASPPLARLFGFGEGVPALRAFLRRLPAKERAAAVATLRRMLRDPTPPPPFALSLRLPDGSTRHLEAVCHDLPADGEGEIHRIGLARETTHRFLAREEKELLQRELIARRRLSAHLLYQTQTALAKARAARLQAELALGSMEQRLRVLEHAHDHWLELLEEGPLLLHIGDPASGVTLFHNAPGRALTESAPHLPPWHAVPAAADDEPWGEVGWGTRRIRLGRRALAWSDGRRVRVTLGQDLTPLRTAEEGLALLSEQDEMQRQEYVREVENWRVRLDELRDERLIPLEQAHGELLQERVERLRTLEEREHALTELEQALTRERAGHQAALAALHGEVEAGRAQLEQWQSDAARERAGHQEALAALHGALEAGRAQLEQLHAESTRERAGHQEALAALHGEVEAGRAQLEQLHDALAREREEELSAAGRESLRAELEAARTALWDAEQAHNRDRRSWETTLEGLRAELERERAAYDQALTALEDQQELARRAADQALVEVDRELRRARIEHQRLHASGRAARQGWMAEVGRGLAQELHLPGGAMQVQIQRAREAWRALQPLLEQAFPPEPGARGHRPPYLPMQRTLEQTLGVIGHHLERLRRLETELRVPPMDGEHGEDTLDLDELVEAALERFHGEWAARGLTVTRSSPSPLPPLSGAQGPVEWMVDALLREVSRQWTPGAPGVTVALGEEDHAPFLRVGFGEVTDDDDPISTGLLLTDRLARQQGCRLEARGRPGEACRITLWFPPTGEGGTDPTPV